ncbi:Uncharacterised protein (plasmid) [Legionella adelaidensis]|uniref:Uncharacterized protein n=1 Tax=Legionella adelaidensis TaxID=45056 RepID=A0A0W0R1R8_9GAMM|nr:hypothetical protein [Legionella adelaidensis]KTC65030.1 hypothetical protein Lade_1553 [Legionella adelaidensis]VEH85451.1 Uncharacterised protein [Legionella adelaidensis]
MSKFSQTFQQQYALVTDWIERIMWFGCRSSEYATYPNALTQIIHNVVGPVCAVVIGVPLRILIGGAYSAICGGISQLAHWGVSLIHWMYGLARPQSQTMDLQTVPGTEGVQAHPMIPASEGNQVVLQSNKPAPLTFVEKIRPYQNKKLIEKKSNLDIQIKKLLSRIKQELSSLNAQCHQYDNLCQKISDLKSRLRGKKYDAETAMKFSHYETAQEEIRDFSLKLVYPQLPERWYRTVTRDKPVYVADQKARAQAQKEYKDIQEKLEQLSLSPTKIPTIEMTARNTLIQLECSLKVLATKVGRTRRESDLLGILREYKTILKKSTQYITQEPLFDVREYWPQSPYATGFYSAYMMSQLTRNNALFQALPVEIQEEIVVAATPNLQAEESREIFGLISNSRK